MYYIVLPIIREKLSRKIPKVRTVIKSSRFLAPIKIVQGVILFRQTFFYEELSRGFEPKKKIILSPNFLQEELSVTASPFQGSKTELNTYWRKLSLEIESILLINCLWKELSRPILAREKIAQSIFVRNFGIQNSFQRQWLSGQFFLNLMINWRTNIFFAKNFPWNLKISCRDNSGTIFSHLKVAQMKEYRKKNCPGKVLGI